MVSLATQLVAIAVAIALLLVVVRGVGLTLSLPVGAALACLVFMALIAIGSFRESWHTLDLQRAHNSQLTPAAARSVCTATGPSTDALTWASRRIPAYARYYVPPSPFLVYGGGTCIRFLFLPRIQVARLRDAQYVLFWQINGEPLLSHLRARGWRIEDFKLEYKIAKAPGA